jgi:hypothetical protein
MSWALSTDFDRGDSLCGATDLADFLLAAGFFACVAFDLTTDAAAVLMA